MDPTSFTVADISADRSNAIAYLTALATSNYEYHLDDDPIAIFEDIRAFGGVTQVGARLKENTTAARRCLGETAMWEIYSGALRAFGKQDLHRLEPMPKGVAEIVQAARLSFAFIESERHRSEANTNLNDAIREAGYQP